MIPTFLYSMGVPARVDFPAVESMHLFRQKFPQEIPHAVPGRTKQTPSILTPVGLRFRLLDRDLRLFVRKEPDCERRKVNLADFGDA